MSGLNLMSLLFKFVIFKKFLTFWYGKFSYLTFEIFCGNSCNYLLKIEIIIYPRTLI